MEFSRQVHIDRLPPGEAEFEIVAAPAERVALARRFGLIDLPRLEARLRLTRLAGGLVRLSAVLSADVVQECVVTLEPVANRVEDQASLLFGAAAEAGGEVVLSGEAEPVEPLSEGVIDLGEVVAQQLSLALDPYPRAPGVETPLAATPPGAPASPFAALAKWKGKR
jgi:hypothetical protein